MNAGAQTAPTTRPPQSMRLNPFSFPSNTDFFFALLMVAILAASIHIFQITVYNRWNGNVDEYLTVAGDCIARYSAVTSGGLSLDNVASASSTLNTCMLAIRQKQALWTSAGLAIELIIAGAIYALYPLWKVRRKKLTLITRSDMPELLDILEGLAREVGLARMPAFYLDMYNLSRNGQAFGRAGRYAVYLPIGLVGELLTGDDQARAVVLHELAHIQNADIDKTYLTMSLWYAFLVAALMPFLLWAFNQRILMLLDTLWRTGVLVGLVLLVRNAVLRSREYYADLRADQHAQAREGLRRALSGEQGKTRRGWLAQLAQVHPAAARRLAILDQPDLLFQQPLWVALATGMIFAIGYDSISLFLQSWDSLHINRMSLIAGLVFSPLVVGVVGLGLWRVEFARKLTGGAQPGILRTALALAGGIFLGRWVSLTEFFSRNAWPLTTLDRVVVMVFDLLWVSFLALVLYLFLTWVKAGASTWLEFALRRPSPRRVYLAGLVVASLLLAPVFSVIFDMVQLGISGRMVGMVLLVFPLSLITYLMVHPLMMLSWVLVWAFPLASLYLLRRTEQKAENHWALLDARLLVPHAAPAITPWKWLLAGTALAAMLCTLGLLILRAGVYALLPDSTRTTDGYKIGVFIFSLLFSYPFQAVAGVWFATRARQLRIFTGQMGAFLTGALCAVGILLVNLVLGGSLDGYLTWTTLAYTVCVGQFASLPFVYLFGRRPAPSALAAPVIEAPAG